MSATTRRQIGTVQILRTRIYNIVFPSKTLGPEEFADLLADPVCVAGPEQRLVFALDGAS